MQNQEAIREFIYELIDAKTDTDLFEASVNTAKHILDADTCEIATVRDGELTVLARADDDVPGAHSTVPITRDIVGQLDLIGRSHVFDDITAVRSVAAQDSVEVESYLPRSLLLVPIESAGLLIATDRDPAAFSSADRTWAEHLGTLIEGILQSDIDLRAGDGEGDRLEQVARILSHDFTGPLTVARGSIDLAEETGDPEYFAKTRAALDRIEDLVDGIETLARTQDHVGHPELLELRSAVEEVWPSIETGDASLVIEGSRSVLADEHALYQLLMNLFSNAVEHGGPDVTVRVGTTENGFYVEDDGEGIPEDHRDKVFEWGFSSAAGQKGIGLGIVEQICEAHDWEIEVVEGEYGGARFEIVGIEGD